MLPDKRKAALTIILGKLAPKGDKPDAEACADCGKEPCECDSTGRETAMGELISAFRAGDAKAALVAWDAVCELAAEPESEPKLKSFPEDDDDMGEDDEE